MLSQIAEAQDRVVSRSQLRTVGITRHRVRSEVRARRWTLLGPRVVVLHTGPLTRRQWWWVATLHAGPRAALHGHTAAEAAGLAGWERRPVHVLVPRGTHVPPMAGLIVHESRRFGDEDLHPTVTPPRTRLPRAAVDAASVERTARSACALLAAVVQQRLAAPAQLWAELEVAGAVRHHRWLRAAIEDIEGGSHSMAEIDFVRLCRRARLPLPERQAIRVDRAGRRRYLDACWRRLDGRLVVAEVDGALHRLVSGWWDDMLRQNEVALDRDAVVLRFPSVQVRLAPEEVADQIARALGLSARTRHR